MNGGDSKIAYFKKTRKILGLLEPGSYSSPSAAWSSKISTFLM